MELFYTSRTCRHAPRLWGNQHECKVSNGAVPLSYPALRQPSCATFARFHQRLRNEGSTIVMWPNAGAPPARRTAAFDEDVLRCTTYYVHMCHVFLLFALRSLGSFQTLLFFAVSQHQAVSSTAQLQHRAHHGTRRRVNEMSTARRQRIV
ncbi:hypothetical protein PR048_000891 [Dryococelus australis]|uniref:Uncharacterized protein n=1 Tax=Dryococelus australis TaxID=614101 RepID=A0ABQ9IHA9_9NEOP|nr:hypothetical protein PR048_000891 [Dryococelus australis]